MFQILINDAIFKVCLRSGIAGRDQFVLQGEVNGKPFDWDVAVTGRNTFHLLVDSKGFNVEVQTPLRNKSAVSKAGQPRMLGGEKQFLVSVNGQVFEATLRDRADELLKVLGMGRKADKQAYDLRAPMPGLLLEVIVKAGDRIKEGDPLLVLEAMKMENIVRAPKEGTIAGVNVAQGQAVEKNQVLLTLA